MESPLGSSIDSAGLLPATPAKQTLAGRLTGMFPWIVSLWLILMTGWYVATTARTLEHPLNRGDDLMWVWRWAGFAVAVVSSHLLVRRRLITLIWLGPLIAVAIAMIALSDQIVAALITGWLLLLAWAWGDWTLRRMGVGRSSLPLDRATVALPLGLALMALVALALCLTHLLTSKWAWLVFSALTLVQGRSLLKVILDFRRLFVSRRPSVGGEPLAEAGILVVLLGFVFLLDLSWALAPEIHYDAVSAHLAVAKYYVEHPVVLLSYGSVANLVDLLFALALSLHGQIVAKLLVLASSVLSTLGVYALGRALFSARVGLWAAALFFSTPLVSWLSTTTYIDATVTMFLLSTLIAFFRWREDRQMGWLWASGLLMGAAIAAKQNALLGLPVIGLILLWDLIRSRQPAAERLKGLVGYILGVGLVAAPGFAVAYALTGNPFFPLPVLNTIFTSPAGPAISLISNAHLFGIGTSPTALLKLPFAFTFETHRFGETLPDGGIGLALVLAPLALITVITGSAVGRRAAILLAVCLVYIACLAFIMQYGRYYIPVLPVVAVLAVVPLVHTVKKWLQGVNLVLLGVVVAAQVALSPLMYWNIPERFPIKMALGLKARESHLSRSLMLYPPVQFLNKKVEPGHKVVAVGGETGRIYLNAPMTTPFDTELEQIVARSTPTTLASHLIQGGFTYLLVNRTSWQSTLPLSYLSEPFLSQFTTLEYTTNNVRVYRLREVAVEPRAALNLLTNPGFELLSESSYPAGWFPYGQPRIAQTNGQAHGGKVAVRADRDDGLFTRVPIVPDKIYSLGHWSRADRPNQFARLQINWLDASSRIVGVSIDVVSAGSQWVWHHFSAIAPERAATAQIYVSVHEDGKVWFDDYVFVQGQIYNQQQPKAKSAGSRP